MQRIQLEIAIEVVARLGFYVRDVGLLDSALERPITRVYGAHVYPTIPLAAAAQSESLARNHALVDGNKRTTLIFLNIFLRINGLKHVMDSDTSYRLIMDIAEGQESLESIASRLDPFLIPWS